jgi:predicted PurR-regulated permease PerM
MVGTKGHLYWICLVALLVSVSFLFFVSSILMPFVAGLAVAYFLDPLADKFEAFGLSRTISTVCIIISFFSAVILLLVLLYPLLQDQFIRLLDKIPFLIKNFEQWAAPLKEALLTRLSSAKLIELSGDSKSFGGPMVQWFVNILKGVLNGSLAIFNAISLILVTPVVSFYLLRDWDKIVVKVDGWLPRDLAPSIRIVVGDIDTTIAGFVRGQGTVCLLLAIFYGINLTIIGLDFGLILGITTGLISFIPYFGMLIGMAAAVVIVISQHGEFLQVIIVLAVFGVGQAIESIFLIPKLVGERVGLHAVWVIFALMVGGAAFGFTGLLLAVPVAATVGVLVRFFVTQYLESDFYLGPPDSDGSL